jgi:hypothetical protein
MPIAMAAREAVNGLMRAVAEAPDRDQASKQAAMLGAWSAREAAAEIMVAVHVLTVGIKRSTLTLVQAEEDLKATIADFTKKADEGTKRLVTWTKVLALTTGIMAFATIALVLVEWLRR